MNEVHVYDVISDVPVRSTIKESNDHKNFKNKSNHVNIFLLLVICITVFFTVISLGVAVFAAVNPNTLQLKFTGDERNTTADVHTSVRELFENLSATQFQVMMLSDDVHRIATMQSNISEMIYRITQGIGPPGQQYNHSFSA